jgi:hypothetical protein
MTTYQPRDLQLQDVVVQIAEGRIRLPEFQRNFTWGLSDQRSLLDSIQKAYPVGTLLLLEVSNADNASPFGQRRFDGAPSPAKEAELLVLDGQQRLSTCYRAFSRGLPRMFCIDLAGLYSSTSGAPKRTIDLADLIVVRARPTHPENLLYNRNLLPFEFLTDRDGLREKLATYRANLMKKPETEDFGRFVDVYLEGYVDVFWDYRFPAVVLPGSLDIEAVANVFTKINTTGLRLSAFDLCVATLFPKGVNLRELWAAARENDEVRALDQDGTNLLQTVALLAGQPPKKSALVKNITPGQINAHWKEAVGGLMRAGTALASVGAPDSSAVPYDAMVPALAAALARAGEPKGPAEREARRRRVARWLQQTAFQQRYNEGTDVKQAADYPAALSWFGGGPEPAFLSDAIVWQESWNRLGRSGARYRGLVALLNDAGPRDFILTATRLGRGVVGRQTAQLHHIFPRAFLRQAGVAPESIDVALNLTFLTPESNNFISDRAPSTYIEDRIQELVNLGTARDKAIAELKTLLAEHLIDDRAWNAMLHDDYEAFLDARADAVRGRLGSLGISVVVAPREETDDSQDEPAGDDLSLYEGEAPVDSSAPA